MKLKLTRLCALLLALVTLCLPLAACKEAEEEIPENMKHATIEGSDYRLFLPIDWTLLTNAGLSGGYASAQNKAIIYVKVYENPSGVSIETFWEEYLAPSLAGAFPDSEGIKHSEFIENKLSGLDALKAAEESLAEQKTQADKQAAQTVTEQIAAIGTVTEDSQNAISAARAAYDELTDIQKGYVENLSILEAAETAFAELQQQESQSQAPVVTSEKSEEETTATSLDTSDLTFDVEKPDGYVTVSFVDNGIRPENANILNAELYGTAVGTIIAATEVPYVEGDSVADVTVRLLKAMNLEYSSTGTADDGFYLSSLNGFELNGTYYATFGEFDAGSQSGWCVRVNNWHINQGSSAVEVEDGDVISWLYTCQYGADIGADFSTRSAEITGVVLADSTLNLAYDAETDQYTCVVPAETTAIAFEVFLENYASIVTMTVDGNTVKYRPNQDIRVTPNSTIVIRSELEYMDAENNNEVTTYTDSVIVTMEA